MIRAAALQYQGPERLYVRRRECGLVAIGFPSNDFGARQPGSEEQICDIWRLTCSVQVAMFARTLALRPDADPLYRHLIAVTGGTRRWNLHRNSPDRKGCGVASFPARVRPDAPRPVTAIEAWR